MNPLTATAPPRKTATDPGNGCLPGRFLDPLDPFMASQNNDLNLPWLRLGIGGIFMGLANLVPGVSGGTMVLALGLYDEFIGAMADLTRLRVSLRAALVLAMLFGLSAVTIAVGAGVIELAMTLFKPGMLALFIGMTLGGAPMLWKEMQPASGPALAGLAAGFLVMAAVAFFLTPDATDPTLLLWFLGGMVASSSMILPGISGSYMLLVLGLYVPLIAGISAGVDALRARDLGTAFDLGIRIGLPVGLGILVGLIAFSNIIKFCLERYHRPTIGFLLGLLVGSVLGLWPFQPQSFDKLPRYAVPAAVQGGADDSEVLNIMGFGFERTPGNQVYDNLMALESPSLPIGWVVSPAADEPTLAHVEAARKVGAIMVAYDMAVDKAVRRAAAEEIDGEDVELIIVPNAEFTPAKAALAALLVIIGFFITFFLGKLKGGNGEGKPSENPDEQPASP